MLLLSLIACGDSDLKKVANGLQITASSISTLQTTAIEANKINLLTEDDTRYLLELCLEVNKAGKDAVSITRGLATLDTPTKTQLITILQPVIIAVDNAVVRTNFIKNEDSRLKFRSILLTIQTALNSIQVIIGVTT